MQKLLSFHYLYLLPLLLSAIFSLKSFRLKWPRAYTVFSVFLVLTFITEVCAIAWKWYFHETQYWKYSPNNLWIYNSMHLVRSSLLILFYYRMLDDSFIKRVTPYLAVPVLLFGIIEYMFITGPHKMNSYTLILTNVLFILFALEFFRQVLRKKELIKLVRHPMTWISLGTFIYYSASLPFFIFFNYLFQHYRNMAISLLFINHGLNIIMYTFYLIAFLCKPHSPK